MSAVWLKTTALASSESSHEILHPWVCGEAVSASCVLQALWRCPAGAPWPPGCAPCSTASVVTSWPTSCWEAAPSTISNTTATSCWLRPSGGSPNSMASRWFVRTHTRSNVSCVSFRYLVFYCPLNLFYKCVAFLPVKLVLVALKEVVRVRKIAAGVHHAHHAYHHGFFIMVIVGYVKGRCHDPCSLWCVLLFQCSDPSFCFRGVVRQTNVMNMKE